MDSAGPHGPDEDLPGRYEGGIDSSDGKGLLPDQGHGIVQQEQEGCLLPLMAQLLHVVTGHRIR